MDKLTQATKNQQIMNLIFVVVGVLVVLGLATWFIVNDNTSIKGHKEIIRLATPLDDIDENNYLLERTQNALQSAEVKTAELSDNLEKVQRRNKVQSVQLNAYQSQLEQMMMQMDALHQKMSHLEGQVSAHDQFVTHKDALTSSPLRSYDEFPPDQYVGGSIYSREFALEPIGLSEGSKKTPENYVPAGTFVRAILLGGMDAPAGVMGQNNPKPLLFRILDEGTLPNHQRSHLRDCLVTAAGVGDISSERGYIRLERLSCTNENGEILDIAVQGSVFGPAGKAGVRGKPVWREGALLQRAALAGLFSGLSEGIAEQYTKTSISPLDSTKSVENSGVFEYGVAQGAANAMEKLADYNIKRAEQYQPIIQISPGTEVDLVFLKGFYLTEHHEASHASTKQRQQRTHTELPDDNFLLRE